MQGTCNWLEVFFLERVVVVSVKAAGQFWGNEELSLFLPFIFIPLINEWGVWGLV